MERKDGRGVLGGRGTQGAPDRHKLITIDLDVICMRMTCGVYEPGMDHGDAGHPRGENPRGPPIAQIPGPPAVYAAIRATISLIGGVVIGYI